MLLLEYFDTYEEAAEWAKECCDEGTYDIDIVVDEFGNQFGVGAYQKDEYC